MRSIVQMVGGLLVVALAATGSCLADSDPGAVQPAQAAEPSVGEIIIGEVERRILRDYYERNARAWMVADPDEANGKSYKHKSLPPGIAKKGTLPPGLAYRDLPPDLVAQLSLLRVG